MTVAAAIDRAVFVERTGKGLRISSLSALTNYELRTTKATSDDQTDVVTSWIQVAVIGDYEHPAYGAFSITKADLKAMRDNFKEGRHPVPPTRICMDYDHLSMDPRRPGDGQAAGWFVDVELRERGTELWAQIEWTAEGAEAIKSKKYQFVSPSFTHHKLNTAGEDIGPALLAAAITNHPFLQGMEPLSLSSIATMAGHVAQPVRVRSLAEFSYGEKGVRVERALHEKFRGTYACGCCGHCSTCNYGCSSFYIVDDGLYDGYVVFRVYAPAPAGLKPGRYRLDYAIDESSGAVTFSGEPQEVVTNWETLSMSDHGGQHMSATATAKTIKLTAIDGKSVEIAADAIEGLQVVKDLRTQIAGMVPKDKHDEMVEQVANLTSTVGELQKSLDAREKREKERDAKDEVQKLLRAGKITPAQVEPLQKLALNAPEEFKALAATFTASVGPRRDTEAGSGDDTQPASAAIDEVTRRIATLRADNKDLSLDAARHQVFREDPALYERWREEGRVKS